MLAYLTSYLLHNPLRVLIGVLLSVLAGGGIGWGTFGREIAGAWTRVDAREVSGRRHVYRDPLRTDSILRPPFVVTAAAIVGYALWIGHAGWLAVAVDGALLGRYGRALLAVGLFGVGARMAYRTHRLVTGGPEPPPELRRRAVADGACGLAVNGVIVAFMAALMMGAFDQHAIEVHGIKGTTGQMTLGEIRELFPQQPVLLSAGGYPLLVWGLLGVWAFSHAVGCILHASLLLLLVRAASGPSSEGPSGQAPRAPWSRRFWWVFPGAGAVVVILGAGLFVTRCAPVMAAKVVYAEVRPVCSLPDLPADASDLQSRHRVDLMSEDAFVQFRVSDPEGYAAPLLSAGYTQVTPAERGGVLPGPEPEPDLPKSVRHYRHHREYSRQPGVFDAATLCDVHVDQASGLVRVWMWAGD